MARQTGKNFYTNLSKFHRSYVLEGGLTGVEGLDKLAVQMQVPNFFEALFSNQPSDWVFRVRAYPLKANSGNFDNRTLYIGNYNTLIRAALTQTTSWLISANFFYGYNENLPFYENNGYVDVSLYLPFLGFVDVDVNLIKDCFVHIVFTVDFLSGYGTYTIIKSAEPITYTELPYICNLGDTKFSNCDIICEHNVQIGVEIPVTSSNVGDNVRNMLTGAVDLLSTMTIGSLMQNPYVATQPFRNVGSNIDNMTRVRATSKTTGGSELCGLTQNFPYFRIAKSVPLFTDTSQEFLIYLHQNGAPLNENVSELFDFIDTGYTELSSFHLDGEDFNRATEQELDELETLLKQGIIL